MAGRISLALAVVLACGMLYRHADRLQCPGGIDGFSRSTATPAIVVTKQDAARLDLEFGAGERYLLIVSCLGDAAREYRVRLHADDLAAPSPVPTSPLVPLPAFVPPQLPATLISATPAQQNFSRSASPLTSHGTSSATSPNCADFFVHVTDGSLDDPKGYARIRSRLVGEGDTVRVYLDEQQPVAELSAGLIEDTVQRMDERVLPEARALLGTHRDVDGDGKLAVLFTPWLSRLQGGRTSLGGFVRGSDFRPHIAAPFSNHRDVLYLNSNLQPGPALQTLLTHEYTHAVCLSQRLPAPGRAHGLPDEEDWLSEAIAHVAETRNGGDWSNLDHRISEFLAGPQQYPLVVPDYYAANLWRNPGCRGATFLFLRWCVDQYGEALLRALVAAPGSGVQNLERVTGVPFAELYRRWTVSLVTVSSSALTNLDLCGQIGRCGLAGVRCTPWSIDDIPPNLLLRGTASAYVELRASAETAKSLRRRIQVHGEPGCGLQLTLLRRPVNLPAFELAAAEWIDASPADMAMPSADDVLSASAADASSEPGMIATAPTAKSPAALRVVAQLPPDLEVAAVNGVCDARQWCTLRGARLQELLQIDNVQNGQRRVRLHVPLPQNGNRGGSWTISLVATDRQGRHVTTWLDMPAPDASIPGAQVASGVGRTRSGSASN